MSPRLNKNAGQLALSDQRFFVPATLTATFCDAVDAILCQLRNKSSLSWHGGKVSHFEHCVCDFM
jgi:hypothetical protein